MDELMTYIFQTMQAVNGKRAVPLRGAALCKSATQWDL